MKTLIYSIGRSGRTIVRETSFSHYKHIQVIHITGNVDNYFIRFPYSLTR